MRIEAVGSDNQSKTALGCMLKCHFDILVSWSNLDDRVVEDSFHALVEFPINRMGEVTALKAEEALSKSMVKSPPSQGTFRLPSELTKTSWLIR